MQPDYEQQKGDTFMVKQMINLFVEHALDWFDTSYPF